MTSTHQASSRMYYHAASAFLLTAALIVEGVSFRVADLARFIHAATFVGAGRIDAAPVTTGFSQSLWTLDPW